MTKQEAIDHLKRNLKTGDRLYGIVHQTSGKGQVIQVLVAKQRNVIEDITSRVAKATGMRLGKKGIIVPGFGFNHVQEIADQLNAVTGHQLKSEQITTCQK